MQGILSPTFIFGSINGIHITSAYSHTKSLFSLGFLYTKIQFLLLKLIKMIDVTVSENFQEQ